MMFKIAIIEDTQADQDRLISYIHRYFKENGTGKSYTVTAFDSANKFLSDYRADYDMAFFDIQLPTLNGMDAVAELRRLDRELPVIFVTNMAQYAVKGYNVNALGFILKPVSYYDFQLRMQKAVRVVESRVKHDVVLTTKQGVMRLTTDDIYYVEVTGHTLRYHTGGGVVTVSGSISDAEEKLKDNDFVRCNNSYLVNLRAIKTVLGFDIRLMNGETVQISHPRKKEFMSRLNEWLGEGKNT